jgi:hypothetical protein
MITVPMSVSSTTVGFQMSVNSNDNVVPVCIEESYSMVVSGDYELLSNKPQINGVELIGNKLLADLFPDGIIVDGGSAEGVI